MNKFTPIFIVCCLLCVFAVLLCGCETQPNPSDYIRLHIRADANTTEAQELKLQVRDELVAYLTVKSREVSNKTEMEALIQSELPALEKLANNVLQNNGVQYKSRAKLTFENFPDKTYGDLTLGAGEYQALIVELGSGQGDNWWCVAYPPLCFIAAEDNESDTVEYKSIIADFFAALGEKE